MKKLLKFYQDKLKFTKGELRNKGLPFSEKQNIRFEISVFSTFITELETAIAREEEIKSELVKACEGAMRIVYIWGYQRHDKVSLNVEGEMQALILMEDKFKTAIQKATKN